VSDEDLKKWNNLAEDYHRFIANDKDIFRKNLLDKAIFDLLGSIRNKRILDAGCGQGYLAHEMSQRGANVIGIDGADNLIKIAKKNYPHPSLSFFVHNLKNPLPFENKSFDIIVANMVLMDFDPLSETVKEFNRALKDDGRFIFSILHPIFGNGYPHKNLKELILRKMPHYALFSYHRVRKEKWHLYGLSQTTTIYHRPLEYYSEILDEAGFVIKKLKELVFENDFTKNQNNFLKLCSEIPVFALFETIKR
jgi:2-polyprenyl-3-methyl-5-hydroxy-6-metoxy-1,4-benzoquinol methylase